MIHKSFAYSRKKSNARGALNWNIEKAHRKLLLILAYTHGWEWGRELSNDFWWNRWRSCYFCNRGSSSFVNVTCRENAQHIIVAASWTRSIIHPYVPSFAFLQRWTRSMDCELLCAATVMQCMHAKWFGLASIDVSGNILQSERMSSHWRWWLV